MYGLSHSQAAPEQLRGGGGSLIKQAEQTRSRLEEAARLKQEDEHSKNAQKYQKREYRTGQLTGTWIMCTFLLKPFHLGVCFKDVRYKWL
jgi:hypothetical protein